MSIAKIRTDLDYRLPGSGRPLAYIVLTREEAEKVCADYAGIVERIETLERQIPGFQQTIDDLAKRLREIPSQ